MVSAATFSLPPIMGHRGVAGLAPENTLAGLRAAAALGLDWVEFDVMLTRDRVPVLFHDDSLKRITGRNGQMADSDFAEVKNLDAGSWFHADFAAETIPSLESAIAVLLQEDLRPNVELKPTPGRDVETAEIAVSALQALWPGDRPPPMVSSFSTMSLAATRVLAPDWPLGFLVVKPPPNWKLALKALNCVSLHVSRRYCSESLVREAQGAGYAVASYTVNERRRARALRRRGVDCLITDNPLKLGSD